MFYQTIWPMKAIAVLLMKYQNQLKFLKKFFNLKTNWLYDTWQIMVVGHYCLQVVTLGIQNDSSSIEEWIVHTLEEGNITMIQNVVFAPPKYASFYIQLIYFGFHECDLLRNHQIQSNPDKILAGYSFYSLKVLTLARNSLTLYLMCTNSCLIIPTLRLNFMRKSRQLAVFSLISLSINTSVLDSWSN